MGLTDNDRTLLDGLILYAEQNKLSIIQAVKRDTGEPVALLCAVIGEDRKRAQTIPIAELIVNRDVNVDYVLMPDVGMTAPDPLDVGEPGVDKPL